MISIILVRELLNIYLVNEMGNIDTEELCPECNEVAILDGEARICYECWQLLVLAEAEEE